MQSATWVRYFAFFWRYLWLKFKKKNHIHCLQPPAYKKKMQGTAIDSDAILPPVQPFTGTAVMLGALSEQAIHHVHIFQTHQH